MGLLNGKVAVVTGASMGIGEAIARKFVNEGATVVLCSRDAGRVEAARERIGSVERTLALACDVRNRPEIERVVSLTLHNFQRIDIWVNNAGYGLVDEVGDMDMSECRRMFETNLFGAIEAMQCVIPAMKRQGSGSIINISSVTAHIAVPYQAAYSATKSAMNSISYATRLELRGSGVNVMTVCPGYIATDFARNAVVRPNAKKVSSGRGGPTADVVADAVLNGYLKNKREVAVPWHYWLFIRLYEWFPSLVEGQMMKRVQPAKQTAPSAQPAGKGS